MSPTRQNTGSRVSIAIMLTFLLLTAPLVAVTFSFSGDPVLAASSDDEIASSPMASGGTGYERNIVLFLHSRNATEGSLNVAGYSTDLHMDTTLDFNETSVVEDVTSQTIYTYYLFPLLAENITANHFDFKVWIWGTTSIGTPKGSIDIDVYEVNSTSWKYVTGQNTGSIDFLTTAELKVVSKDFNNYTFQANSSIVVNVTIDPSSADSLTFAYDTAKANSRFSITTTDGVAFEDVYTLDYNGLMNRSFNPTELNKTIYITANLSDPLGGYDIKWVNVTLESPSGEIILDNISMTRTFGSNISLYSEFQKDWNYTGYTNGRYNYTIWMTDNSGHNHYYHLQQYVWGNYTDESSDFFTLGNMVYANIKVIDSKDVPLQGATIAMQKSTTDIITNRASTNGTGMYNFTTLFTGTYDVLVFWQEVIVANVSTNITQNITEDDPLVINASVYYPVFKIVDDDGVVLEDASVFVEFPNGTFRAEPFKTNSSGEFNLTQVANGTYRLDVKWMDVLVNETWVDVTSNKTLTIYTSVYYLIITVVDSRGAPLAGAQVVLANSTSEIVFDSKITNLSGKYRFRLPSGDYDIAVFWQNTLVYSKVNYTFDSNAALTIIADIFYLVVKVLDTHGIPVESAQVVVSATEGNVLASNFTDEQGRIDSRLPRGTHWVQIFWLGVEVNKTQVTFTNDSEVTIIAAIFYPTFTIKDADGEPLSIARIDFALNGTGDVVESLLTDENGTVLVRLPSTNYDILVYWKEVKVYNGWNIQIVDDSNTELKVSVFNLEILCVDSRDVPLKDAHVSMTLAEDGREMASIVTDQNGSAVVRLPGAVYNIEVYWQSTMVALEAGVLLDASGQNVIYTSVFYMEGTVLDSQKIGLPGAMVEVSDDAGKVLNTMLTDDNGSFTVRLPVGIYSISISWKERIVNQTSGLQLESDLEIGFMCSVYYLEISPFDSKGIFLGDALVTVSSKSTGKIVATGTTGVVATVDPVAFRLPGDTYELTVHWKGVLVNTTSSYTLTSDDSLEMVCSVYYLSVLVLDTGNKIVEEAEITLDLMSIKGSFMVTTDDTGIAGFRLPGADYGISVAWQDIIVYEEASRSLSSDDIWNLEASIYHPKFILQDSRMEAIGGAHIDIYGPDDVLFESTDVSYDGAITSRLPASTYRVVCTWLGYQVLDTKVEINSNEDVVLKVMVYYFETEVVDSRSLALGDAVLNLLDSKTGALVGTGITDADGNAVIRLPTSNYDIRIFWRSLMVFEEAGLVLDKDVSKAIEADVFYLTMRLNDDRQITVEGALVNLFLYDQQFESKLSDINGEVTFRLPSRDYTSVITWQTIEIGAVEDIRLLSDVERTVDLNIYYLTISVKDSTGEKLKGALVSVKRDGEVLFGAAQTKGDGMAEFRLPKGEYTIEVKYSSTYLMTAYSSTETKEINLDSSLEVKFAFSDYPPPIYSTNTFLVSMLSMILLIMIIVASIKMLKRSKGKSTG